MSKLAGVQVPPSEENARHEAGCRTELLCALRVAHPFRRFDDDTRCADRSGQPHYDSHARVPLVLMVCVTSLVPCDTNRRRVCIVKCV